MRTRVKAGFISPMLLARTDRLPDDASRWEYGLKLDGYRAIAFKSGGAVSLRSRNDNDFSRRYAGVLPGLAHLPAETVIDGEVVAMDEQGRPSFNLLQNFSPGTPLVYFVFDVMLLAGRDVMREPLRARRRLLEEKVLPHLKEPVRYLGALDGTVPVLVQSVKAFGLEGLVAKRLDSRYEPGLRSGAWMKMRVSRGQELVIGGYTLGSSTFDALIVGYFDRAGRLIYVGRTRNGFTPAVRAQLFARFRGLEIDACPFVNLPEARSGRWGQGLTAQKMAECRWLRPVLVGQFEFVEWTADNHLRHPRFVGLRDDKAAREVTREDGPSGIA